MAKYYLTCELEITAESYTQALCKMIRYLSNLVTDDPTSKDYKRTHRDFCGKFRISHESMKDAEEYDWRKDLEDEKGDL